MLKGTLPPTARNGFPEMLPCERFVRFREGGTNVNFHMSKGRDAEKWQEKTHCICVLQYVIDTKVAASDEGSELDFLPERFILVCGLKAF